MFSSHPEDYEIINKEEGKEMERERASAGNSDRSRNMTTAGGLQVKAILLREGVEGEDGGPSKEIRRFRVEDGEVGVMGEGGEVRFRSLLTRVHSVFGIDPATHRCTLYWKDGDGDMVLFSTDGELFHALEAMPDSTLRVFVSVDQGEGEFTETDPGQCCDHERNVRFDVTPEDHSALPCMATPLGCPGLAEGQSGRKCRGQHTAQDKAKVREFKQVRQQVPECFRAWVRLYVRTWHAQGAQAATQQAAEAVQAGSLKPLPASVGQQFPSWLELFLQRHLQGEEAGETMQEEEEGPGEELLPPVYYRWLQLFVWRFYKKGQKQFEGEQAEGIPRKCHKGRGKHGCHKNRGDNRKAKGVSESEESDTENKPGKNVPKEFRRFARVTVRQMHKGIKGDNSSNKEKAAADGVSAETQEFVQQAMLEWHAKLTNQPPGCVAMEMTSGERTLPEGMERDHFLWLCRFLSRWHRRHAAKCDVMSAWSSGETTSATDDDGGAREDQESGSPCCEGGDGVGDYYGPWTDNNRRGRGELRAFMKTVRGQGHHPRGHPQAMRRMMRMMMRGGAGHPHPHFYPPPPPFTFAGFPPGQAHCCPRGHGVRGGMRGWGGCRGRHAWSGPPSCYFQGQGGATTCDSFPCHKGETTEGATQEEVNGTAEKTTKKM